MPSRVPLLAVTLAIVVSVLRWWLASSQQTQCQQKGTAGRYDNASTQALWFRAKRFHPITKASLKVAYGAAPLALLIKKRRG